MAGPVRRGPHRQGGRILTRNHFDADALDLQVSQISTLVDHARRELVEIPMDDADAQRDRDSVCALLEVAVAFTDRLTEQIEANMAALKAALPHRPTAAE